jgi:DnaJ like chaperone protein
MVTLAHRLLKKYFGIDDEVVPGAQRVFVDAAASRDDGMAAAKEIRAILEDKREPLEYILIGLMQVAAADGRFHRAEVDFIRRIAEVFSFSKADVERLFSVFKEFDEHRASSRDKNGKKAGNPWLANNLRILGLEGEVSFGTVKTAYRELVKKHHPDLLRAQGVPAENIRNAEKFLKVINVTYEWLERHYEGRK